MAGVPFAAASGPNAIVATLRFNPVPDEDMLPEARKEIAETMWEVVVHNGIDCIFEDRLPAHEEYSYTETPLVTVYQCSCSRRKKVVPQHIRKGTSTVPSTIGLRSCSRI